jgi:hypothetical protein
LLPEWTVRSLFYKRVRALGASFREASMAELASPLGGVLFARVKLLAIMAIGGCHGGTNGYQIVVADFPDVACSKSDQSLGATRGGDEFHFDGIGRVDINDCAQIATLQPVGRKVRVQHDDVKPVKAHLA